MENFEVLNKIGDGTFGVVLKAVQKSDNQLVAIKQMKKKFGTWDQCLSLREVKSLKLLGKHDNIVLLKEVFLEKENLYFVFEFMDHTLLDAIKAQKKKPFSSRQIQSITTQILLGLQHMHKNGFFHRDLKPENVLISGSKVKIADFGLAREIRSRPPFTEYVSTRWYRAPEIILRSTRYSSPMDLWAVGAIVAELFMLRALFPGSSELDQMYRITSILGLPQNANIYFADRVPGRCRSMNVEEKGKASSSRYEFVYAGGGWPEGHRLAQAIGFKFSNLTPTPLDKVLPQAPREALLLVADMLAWNPQFRPTAQEALEYPWLAAKASELGSVQLLYASQQLSISNASANVANRPVSESSIESLSSPTPPRTPSDSDTVSSVEIALNEQPAAVSPKLNTLPDLDSAKGFVDSKPSRKFMFSLTGIFSRAAKKEPILLPTLEPKQTIQAEQKLTAARAENYNQPILSVSQSVTPVAPASKALQPLVAVKVTQKLTESSASSQKNRRRLTNSGKSGPLIPPTTKVLNDLTKTEAIDSILNEIDSIDSDFIL